MVTTKGKRITEVMRNDTEHYGSKSPREFRRILAGEKDIGRVPYREYVRLDVERPRLYTESYKATEGEPMVIRRAKALAYLLDPGGVDHFVSLGEEDGVGDPRGVVGDAGCGRPGGVGRSSLPIEDAGGGTGLVPGQMEVAPPVESQVGQVGVVGGLGHVLLNRPEAHVPAAVIDLVINPCLLPGQVDGAVGYGQG